MSEEHTIKGLPTDLKRGLTNFEQLEELKDEDIAAAVADDPDAAPLDLDWSEAELVLPEGMTQVRLFVDEDVLAFFENTGPDYQARINAILRRHMESQKKGGS